MPKEKAENITIKYFNIPSVALKYYEKLRPGKYTNNKKQAVKNFRNLKYIELNVLQKVMEEMYEEQMDLLKKARQFPEKKKKK